MSRSEAQRAGSGLKRDSLGVYLYLIAAAAVGTSLMAVGSLWLLPLGQTLLAYVVLARDLKAGRQREAVVHMVVWALAVSVCTIEATIYFPDVAARAIWRGDEYRQEMFSWIRTGIGPEGSLSQFLPQHIRHYLIVLVLSLATGGLGGLFLGALLLNYMNFYVGSLVIEGANPLLASLVGWPIWSMVRVIGFIIGSIAVAHVFYARALHRTPWQPGTVGRMLLLSFALFVADILLKAVLAPVWRSLLARALG